jgi:hypothetical protein
LQKPEEEMKKLTLAILFVIVAATQSLAGPPASKNLRAAFESAKTNHRAEMKAIQLEAVLMSEARPKSSTSRETVADAQRPVKSRRKN